MAAPSEPKEYSAAKEPQARGSAPPQTLFGNFRGADAQVLLDQFGDPDGNDVMRWLIAMVRLAFILGAIVTGIDLVRWGYVMVPGARWPIAYNLLNLITILLFIALSFQRNFAHYWKLATLCCCTILMVGWVLTTARTGRPELLFDPIVLTLMASCGLIPWEIPWQTVLTGIGVTAAAMSTAMLAPNGPDISRLWLELAVASIIGLATKILWQAGLEQFAEVHGNVRREVAERQVAERKLQESLSKLRNIFEVCPDIVAIINLAERRAVEINKACLAMGYTREELLHWDGSVTWFADTSQRDELMRRVAAEGIVQNCELELRMKDGTTCPYLMSAVRAEVDGQNCLMVFARDITSLKRTQNELIAARKAADAVREAALAASRAKSEFLSSMSHEIRTPMNAILGMTDLLAETQLTPEQRRFVGTMTSNGNALLSLINGILDLARIESGRLNLEETELDLEELVEHIAETLGVRANEKGIELTTRIMAGVPRRLIGDALRLRQVLINLAGNAIKFTDRGEVAVTVECEPGNGAEREFRFIVRDTGIGIDSEKLVTIFQSFTQADSSSTRKYGGSGLGLTIASRLVELMGGRIWATSEPGKGSTFSFTVRLNVAEGQPAPIEKVPYLDGVRVLVVDDNATNRMILREILSAHGADVHEAGSGDEAIAEAERARTGGSPYRLVLLDARMPGMNGFQVAARLRRDAGSSPPIVLMLSSEELSRGVEAAREVGVDVYIVKPIRRSELLRAIAKAMGRSAVEPKAAITKGSQPAPAATEPMRPLKILLAEDSPDNRQLIIAYLKNTPYELDHANNGAVAFSKFTRGLYDLVLMDVQMPVMDGYTAVMKIREWEREQRRAPTPIAALTASALEEDVRASVAAGCNAHLSKPIKKSLLLSVIKELTANSPSAAATGSGRFDSDRNRA